MIELVNSHFSAIGLIEFLMRHQNCRSLPMLDPRAHRSRFSDSENKLGNQSSGCTPHIEEVEPVLPGKAADCQLRRRMPAYDTM